MGACQSSTRHVEGAPRDLKQNSKLSKKQKRAQPARKGQVEGDPTDFTGSHNDEAVSPSKTVGTVDSHSSSRSYRASAKYKKKGSAVDGKATVGVVPWKMEKNNAIGSSGVKHEMRGGVTEGDGTIGAVPWKSGENNAIRSSDVRFQMQGGATETLQPEDYTGPLVPGRDFAVRTYVPTMGAATGTPSFAIAHKERGKISDEVDHTRCSRCHKAAHGVMVPCECGNSDCRLSCHTACAAQIRPAPSLSFPGTPAPRLPLILCSNGVKYTLKKKMEAPVSDFKAETKVAILKDSNGESEVPRGIAEGKPLPAQKDFTAETKVAILKDSTEEGEIPRCASPEHEVSKPKDFMDETKVAILKDSDEEEEIPRGEAAGKPVAPPKTFTSETKVATLKDSDKEEEIPRGAAEEPAVVETKDFADKTKVAILKDSDKEEEAPRGSAEEQVVVEKKDFTDETKVAILKDNREEIEKEDDQEGEDMGGETEQPNAEETILQDKANEGEDEGLPVETKAVQSDPVEKLEASVNISAMAAENETDQSENKPDSVHSGQAGQD